jgi:hypothetical protein
MRAQYQQQAPAPPPFAPNPGCVPFFPNRVNFPRGIPINFNWSCLRQPNAREYRFEVDYADPGAPEGWSSLVNLNLPADKPLVYQCYNFEDPKPGRWRATVYLDDGRSLTTGYLYFWRR